MSEPTQAALVACPGTVGSKPWWMGEYQWDGPCPCILPPGHEPPCVCDHTKEADRG